MITIDRGECFQERFHHGLINGQLEAPKKQNIHNGQDSFDNVAVIHGKQGTVAPFVFVSTDGRISMRC